MSDEGTQQIVDGLYSLGLGRDIVTELGRTFQGWVVLQGLMNHAGMQPPKRDGSLLIKATREELDRIMRLVQRTVDENAGRPTQWPTSHSIC